MLHNLLVVVHVIICFVLATVVLLQSSKGGGLAGAFGGAGGAPQQLLGSRGITTLLHKLTIWCAVGFFLTSFLLFMTDSSGDVGGSSVLNRAAREGDLQVPTTETTVPAATDEAPLQTPDETDDATTDGGGSQ